MSYGSNGLSFNTLRDANEQRLKNDKYKKCQTHWTHAHWIQALVGELGELANILKKLDRGDFTFNEVETEISNELADVQCYLDLLAMKLGVNLGEATKEKFNVVSERIGSRVYIGDDGDWHLWPENFKHD